LVKSSILGGVKHGADEPEADLPASIEQRFFANDEGLGFVADDFDAPLSPDLLKQFTGEIVARYQPKLLASGETPTKSS
jgi:hypothetical protein